MQVVGTALADDDAMTDAIHVVVDADRRIVRDEIGAFDQQVRRRECDAGAAHRIDREEADVGALVGDRIDRLARRVEHDELECDAQAIGETRREVDRDADRSARRVLAPREDRIAEG